MLRVFNNFLKSLTSRGQGKATIIRLNVKDERRRLGFFQGYVDEDSLNACLNFCGKKNSLYHYQYTEKISVRFEYFNKRFPFEYIISKRE